MPIVWIPIFAMEPTQQLHSLVRPGEPQEFDKGRAVVYVQVAIALGTVPATGFPRNDLVAASVSADLQPVLGGKSFSR
jgi:hypothetical protein